MQKHALIGHAAAIGWFVALLTFSVPALAQTQSTGQPADPTAIFGPEQVQIFQNCYMRNKGNSDAIGKCVGVGVARNWADNAVGKTSRKCIENPRSCGRVITDPLAEIQAWRNSWLTKIKRWENELDAIATRASDPSKELNNLAATVRGDLANIEGDLRKLSQRLGNPKGEIQVLGNRAAQEVKGAIRNLNAKKDKIVARINQAGGWSRNVIGQVEHNIVRTGKKISNVGKRAGAQITQAPKAIVRNAPKAVKGVLLHSVHVEQFLSAVEKLKNQNELPRNFKISASDLPTTDSIKKAESRVINQVKQYAQVKLADIRKKADKLLYDVAELISRGQLPKNFNIAKSSLISLDAIKKASNHVSTSVTQYVQGVAGGVSSEGSRAESRVRHQIKRNPF